MKINLEKKPEVSAQPSKKINLEENTEDGGQPSKSQITDKIKSENAVRYDQMLIDSDIVRNDVFYINFQSSYVNLTVKKAVFAMIPAVKSYFDQNCGGGTSNHGEVCQIDKKFIKSIKDSDCNIAKKEFEGSDLPNNFKSNSIYQQLKQGVMNWSDPNAKKVEAPGKGSIFGDLKSAVSDVKGVATEIGSSLNTLGDKLGTFDGGKGVSESEEYSSLYSSLKSNYFSKLKFDYNGTKLTEAQPTYFIPEQTHSETCHGCNGEKYVDCKKCDARHIYTCPSCNGSGELDCPTCKGGEVSCSSCSGKGHNDNGRCGSCHGRGYKTCSKCNGHSRVKCSNSGNSSTLLGRGFDAAREKEFCDGKGQITCKKCYGDTQRYGKVDCGPCKATGEIGKIVYIEIEVGNISGEFYKYTNEIIEHIKKQPEILFKYINKPSVKPVTVYSDINGIINEKYDTNSELFGKDIESLAGLFKNNEYPRIISEEVFYSTIPLSTLEYNHILSGTMHKLSGVKCNNNFDVIFHSDPTAVKKFDIANVFKAIGWDFKKAFATKTYKEKLDKKHEIYLLVRVAKADGVIEDSEKRVLIGLISNLNDFSNKEKAELFNLFSAKELPILKEEETVFSTKERAAITFLNLDKMMKEDGEIEAPEVKIIANFKEKINANIGKHPGFFASFFKTWQVSVPLILLLFIMIGVIFFASKINANAAVAEAPITTNPDSPTSEVIETPVANSSSVIEEQKDNDNTSTEENTTNIEEQEDTDNTSTEENTTDKEDDLFSSGFWVVVLGSFKKEEDASALIKKCAESNIKVELLYTNNFEKLAKGYYFVSAGKQMDYESANKIAEEIKIKGFDDTYAKDAGEYNNIFPAEYMAVSQKAYFYDAPDPSTVRKSFIIKEQTITISREDGDYYYGSCTYNGRTTEGFMQKKDLRIK